MDDALDPPCTYTTPPYATFVLRFGSQANSLATKYGGKVWLVGGALREGNPRDYDVRIVIGDQDWLRLFREAYETSVCEWLPQHWARARDNLKQSRLMSLRMCENVDVQIQHASEVEKYALEMKVRLDSAEDEFFL